MFTLRIALLAGVSLAVATAQNISLGIIGGVSPGDDYRTTFAGPLQHTTGYPIGLSLEFGILPNFSLEVDGIYRQQHFPDGPGSVVTWQIPILAKYRFNTGKLKPFIEGGPSLRPTGNLNANPSHYGVTAGAGLALYAGRFKIEPTVRYTRWAKAASSVYNDEVLNRVEFLVDVSSRTGGISWRPLGHRVSVGAVLGATLTPDFQTQSYSYIVIGTPVTYTRINGSGPRSFIAGPTIEVELNRRISIEGDAIYRPLRESFKSIPSPDILAGSGISTSVTWEFPILAKYRFGGRSVKPLIELGPSFRNPIRVGGSPLALLGVTAGTGVEARWKALRITPVVRYSHWGYRSQLSVEPNEVVALVGISF